MSEPLTELSAAFDSAVTEAQDALYYRAHHENEHSVEWLEAALDELHEVSERVLARFPINTW